MAQSSNKPRPAIHIGTPEFDLDEAALVLSRDGSVKSLCLPPACDIDPKGDSTPNMYILLGLLKYLQCPEFLMLLELEGRTMIHDASPQQTVFPSSADKSLNENPSSKSV